MTREGREHAALIRALVNHVREITLATDHIGTTYAASQGLHPTDFRALTLIYHADSAGRPLSARRLAEALSLSPGAVTYAVDRLAAAGHVWRDTDNADRRKVVLRITSHGTATAQAFFGPLGTAHTHTLASFTDDELTITLRVLSDVSTALREFEDDLA